MLFLCFALVGALTIWYISVPLLGGAQPVAELEAPTGETLPERRDNLLRQLKELEFDYSMGKIEPQQYENLRGELSSETAQVLSQLESASTQQVSLPGAALSTSSTRNLDLEIELEIQIARARRRSSSEPSSTWSCSDCGRTMSADDRFCASCGTRRA
jgi:rRNA maturation endonuclease Nob1